MMKISKTLMMIGAMLASMVFAPLAAAQVAEPQDTQARTAANLVNQVSAANFKAVAEHPATANNILSQAAAAAASTVLSSAASSFDRRQSIADAALAVALKSFNTMDPKESLSLAKGMSSDLSQQMMQLLTAINAGGVASKSQMNVPPAVIAK